MHERITLKMIAAQLGVSVQAVSMALRGHQDISPATRERIEQKARELGYQPDPGLRALADYRTRRRGVSSRWSQIALVHNWPSEKEWREDVFHRLWFKHIESAATARGMRIGTHWLGMKGERADSVFRLLLNRGTTGVLIAPPALTPEEPRVISPGPRFQVVTFGPEHLYSDHHTVQSDYYENLRLAWKHLGSQGKRRIGLVYHQRQGWRTGHAWLGAYHVEKQLAGLGSETLPPLALGPDGDPADRDLYLKWVKEHRLDAIISSVYELEEWNRRLRAAPAVAYFNVRRKGQQGIDLNLGQMGETAIELLLMEMQRSLVNRRELPFRVHIPGRWVEA